MSINLQADDYDRTTDSRISLQILYLDETFVPTTPIREGKEMKGKNDLLELGLFFYSYGIYG